MSIQSKIKSFFITFKAFVYLKNFVETFLAFQTLLIEILLNISSFSPPIEVVLGDDDDDDVGVRKLGSL
jgi:hypothetical protein